MKSPLPLFIWSKTRILPVRMTDFSITEEAFDPSLNPIRAKVSLGMRVLTVDDLGFEHKGGSLFMAYAAEGAARDEVSPAARRLGIGASHERHRAGIDRLQAGGGPRCFRRTAAITA